MLCHHPTKFASSNILGGAKRPSFLPLDIQSKPVAKWFVACGLWAMSWLKEERAKELVERTTAKTALSFSTQSALG
jgi:hypothetical protein